MKNSESLENKLAKWVDKTKRGEEGFRVTPVVQMETHILAMDVAMRLFLLFPIYGRGANFSPVMLGVRGSVPSENGELVAVLKDRKKLLLMDNDVGIFASGASENSEEDATRAILYFQCERIAALITASSDLSSVQVVDYLLNGEDDPLQIVLHDLLNHIPVDIQNEEVAGNA